jgi:diguanylate cyclase (GGDEF)-like protein
VARAQRREAPLGVVMIDLDGFKEINDTYGHQTGDIVLTQAAERMQAAVRVYDMLGRYGGDEFLLLLPDCNLTDALNTAERVRTAVVAKPCATPDGELALTVSVGVTSTSEFEAPQPEDLIRDADRALYLAKARGRNQVQACPGRFQRTAAPLEASGVRAGR